MNIDEAITELNRWLIKPYSEPKASFSESVKLGIEALHQIQYFQRMEQPYKGLTLPSETKD